MLKTFISILLSIALCVCSVGCAATGSSTASVKNQVDSASVNDKNQNNRMTLETTVLGMAIFFVTVVPVVLLGTFLVISSADNK